MSTHAPRMGQNVAAQAVIDELLRRHRAGRADDGGTSVTACDPGVLRGVAERVAFAE